MTPFRRQLALIAVVFLVVGGVVALATGGEDAPMAAVPQASGNAVAGSALSGPASIGAPVKPRTPEEKQKARDTDRKLPVALERAAARLFLVGFAGTDPSASFFRRLGAREWGGVLLGPGNYVDRTQFLALTGELAVVARNAGHLPPLVAGLGVGGPESTVPSAGLGSQVRQRTVATAKRVARSAGGALRRAGIRAVLGPSGDLQQEGGPWATRAFPGEAPAVARILAGAVSGWEGARVAPIVGHFPGEGAASQDPDLGVATVGLSEDELEDVDERPFAAVAKQAPAVQLSGALYAGVDGAIPATLSSAVVDRLRDTGFEGAIVSANLTSATLATGGTVGEAAVDALQAGCDVLYVPGDADDQEAAYRTVVRAVRGGVLSTDVVRRALARGAALRRAAGV